MEVEEQVKQAVEVEELDAIADEVKTITDTEAITAPNVRPAPAQRKSKITDKKKIEQAKQAQPIPQARKSRRATLADDDEAEAGVAAWVLTFADLMSLLMAFFVLLYSMSEVDKAKFEQFGKSMKQALGKPVEMNDDIEELDPSTKPTPEQTEKLKQKTRFDTEELKQLLQPQIEDKKIEIEQHGQVIMIRMLQQGVFKSGEAELEDSFIPVLEKISAKLNTIKGELIVSGHTDNVPVIKDKFRSNWELSASRAYSVIEVLQAMHHVDAGRFVLRGYGETRPQVPNDSAENRAKNRRVEIMIDQRSVDPEVTQTASADLQTTVDDVLAEKASFTP